MLEVEKQVMHVENAVGNTGQGVQGTLEAKKGEKMNCPLRTSRENQSCPHLHFSPLKLTSRTAREFLILLSH